MSSSEEHDHQSHEWVEERRGSPGHPTPDGDFRGKIANPPKAIVWEDAVHSHQEPGGDYLFSNHQLDLKTSTSCERQTAYVGFCPLCSPTDNLSLTDKGTPTDNLSLTDKGTPFSFGSSTTLYPGRPGMSENDFALAADAPGDLPIRHTLQPLNSRGASVKSFQHLKRAGTLSTMRSHLGLIPEAPILMGHDVHNHLTWSGIRVIMREPFAEFLGTLIMVLFGDGSVAQVLLSGGEAGWGIGDYQSINWCWGIGVMLGVYVAGDSGAFLNPAVMLAFCLFRGFPWKRFPIYFLAQVVGAFAGSGIVYANYINAINTYEGHNIRTVPGSGSKKPTAGIFCTYPQPFLSKASQFFSEFIASTILVFVIFALKDESNPGAMGKSGAGKFFPIALLFLIFGIGAAFGWETGYAINLARDFGPRLMSYAVGYGPQVWTAGNYYFWVPMVAPFLGGAFGGFLYDVFIYTGPESPINTPWWGFRDLFRGNRLGGDGRGLVRAQLVQDDGESLVSGHNNTHHSHQHHQQQQKQDGPPGDKDMV